MAIRTDYTITDEVENGLAEVSVSGAFDSDQDTFVVTLHQNGSEIVLSDAMVKDLLNVIDRVGPNMPSLGLRTGK